MTVLRTIVAVHGITAGGNAKNTGYGKQISGALSKFIKGPGKALGSFEVPIVEALWADEAQRFVSTQHLADAQAVILRALSVGLLSDVPKLLKRFGVPDLSELADLVADVFIYDGPTRTRRIKDVVRQQLLAAHAKSKRGVILYGNSLGSVVALDILMDLIAEGRIGAAVPKKDWPVRGLFTTGSPLGIDVPLISGFVDRAARLAKLLPQPLKSFPWLNLYDASDPVASGNILGIANDPSRLARITGYGKLRLTDLSPNSGFHLQAHTGYWDHPMIAQQLLAMANFKD